MRSTPSTSKFMKARPLLLSVKAAPARRRCYASSIVWSSLRPGRCVWRVRRADFDRPAGYTPYQPAG